LPFFLDIFFILFYSPLFTDFSKTSPALCVLAI
jgi:hypothetical protein